METLTEKGSVPVSKADIAPPVPSSIANIVDNEYTMLIGKRPKLYDLNKNFTNFEIEFQIDAEKPDLKFYVHILPQDQLDKTDLNDISMKMVQGRISGKVSNGNNVYQNYFVILKSATEEEAKVVIRTRTHVLPIMATDDSTPAHAGSENYSDTSQQQITTEEAAAITPPKFLSLFQRPTVRYIIIAVVIGALLCGAAYYFMNNGTKKPITKTTEITDGNPQISAQESVPETGLFDDSYFEEDGEDTYDENPGTQPYTAPASPSSSRSSDSSHGAQQTVTDFILKKKG